jgi:hypothetical protein
MALSLDLVHRLNLRQIAEANEEVRKQTADDLIAYYLGDHLPLVHRQLEKLLKEGSIRETWKTLAAFRNITARIIHAVTLVGREPIAITFKTDTKGPNETAQIAWNAWHDMVEWPLAVSTYFQYGHLLGTALIQPYWDDGVGAVALRLLTPNLVEVRFQEGNRDLREPDLYSILIDQKDGRYEVWDLKNRQKWEENANGERIEPAEDVPVEYGDPFVAIRTGYPVDSFWFEGGAEELLHVQERVNYLLTQRMVSLFYGGKFPIIEGAQGQNETSFVLDISKITFTGIGEDTQPRKLRWDGPDVAATVDALFDTLRDEINAVCEAYGMPPGSFRAQESVRSGVAIELESAPMRDKMRRDRVIHTPTVRRLVRKVLDIWTYHDPQRAPGGTFDIDIPEPHFAQLEQQRAMLDLADIEAGFLRPIELILQRHPDWDEAGAMKYLQQCAQERRMMMAGATFGVGLGGGLVRTPAAAGAGPGGAPGAAGAVPAAPRVPLRSMGTGGQTDSGQNG